MPGSIGTISLITQVGEFERKYFINNPDITFFKSVYRKHTNFSKYLKRDMRPSFTGTQSEYRQFPIKSGSDDLLSKIYLENKFKFKKKGTKNLTIFANLGSNMISDNDDNSLSIDIGTIKPLFKSSGLFQEVKGELLNQMSLTSVKNVLTEKLKDSVPLVSVPMPAGETAVAAGSVVFGAVTGVVLTDPDTIVNVAAIITLGKNGTGTQVMVLSDADADAIGFTDSAALNKFFQIAMTGTKVPGDPTDGSPLTRIVRVINVAQGRATTGAGKINQYNRVIQFDTLLVEAAVGTRVGSELAKITSIKEYLPNYTQAPSLELDEDNSKIYCKNGSHYNYTTLSGGVRGLVIPKEKFDSVTDNTIETEYFYTIPEFSFMKDYGLCIPLLSLRQENIMFNTKYKSFGSLFSVGDDGTLDDEYDISLESNIIQELIQLDNAEKSRFLTSQLTYLTESINERTITDGNINVGSSFKMCKYLLLVGDPSSLVRSISVSQTTPTPVNFEKLSIYIDGNSLYDGTQAISSEIFTKININKYFIGCGRDLGNAYTKSLGQSDTIAMVPFSIEPLNFTQPSGCVSNMGANNKISFNFDMGSDLKLILFTINYNILQISDGRAQSLLNF